jgi:hypothetical protein
MPQTKWEDRFDKIIVDGGGFYPEAVKQFIKDLRKKDEEELINYLKKSDRNDIYQLIKDYYNLIK